MRHKKMTELLERTPTPEEALLIMENSLSSSTELTLLMETADAVRRNHFGNSVVYEAAFNSVVPCELTPLCLYCPYWREKGKQAMTIAEILTGIAYLRDETNVRRFHLSGGSSLRHRGSHIVDIVSAIREAGFNDFDIIVNCGASFSEEELKALSELKVKRIFSVIETGESDVFSWAKPGDDLPEKLNFAHRIAQTGMEVGSGLMAGLSNKENRSTGYIKSLFLLKDIPNLQCIYISKFRQAPHIAIADKQACPTDEGLALIALTRLIFPTIEIRAAAGWTGTERMLAAKAGAGNITIPAMFPKESSYWKETLTHA